MSDPDLKRDLLDLLRIVGSRYMGARDMVRRVEAAEIREPEPSRLERVRAALPEGMTAHEYRADKRMRIRDRAGFVVAGYRNDSPVTPEEAARMAARLAGVEDGGDE